MAYQGVIDDFRKAIALEIPSRVPVCACSERIDVRVCGRGYKYSRYDSNGAILAATQIAAVKRFDYDWSWLQVDDCIVYEVLGAEVTGEPDLLRAVTEHLPPTRESLNSLKMPYMKLDGRMPVLNEAIRRVKNEFGEELLVCGRTEAPFSSVVLLFGETEAVRMSQENPQLLSMRCGSSSICRPSSACLSEMPAPTRSGWEMRGPRDA